MSPWWAFVSSMWGFGWGYWLGLHINFKKELAG